MLFPPRHPALGHQTPCWMRTEEEIENECDMGGSLWSGRAVWKRFVQLSTVCLHEWFVRVVRHSEILQQVLPLPFLVPFS